VDRAFDLGVMDIRGRSRPQAGMIPSRSLARNSNSYSPAHLKL
jgi:hypothetical protein